MIQIHHLEKSYGGVSVLKDVSADLPDGKISFLMGRNGAGKTTLLKALLGLEAHRGEVLYDGASLPTAYGRIGVVYDDVPLYRRLTGYQNIRVLCARRIDMAAVRRFTGGLLSDAELRRRAGVCSHGQRKKLALAIALLGDPDYLMMDEVSNGLDYETMEWLKRELRARAFRATVLLTGHQLDFYDSLADHVLLLKDGCVREVAIRHTPQVQRGLGVLYESALQNAER